MRTSDEYKSAKESMAKAFESQWEGPPLVGPVRACVTSYWPRMHRKGPADGQPVGDVDAVLKCTLDALQLANVVQDDAQIDVLVARKRYGGDEQRIEVTLDQPDTNDERDPIDCLVGGEPIARVKADLGP
jgi:Holliday junction resolvase RusA-like endonuclease